MHLIKLKTKFKAAALIAKLSSTFANNEVVEEEQIEEKTEEAQEDENDNIIT